MDLNKKVKYYYCDQLLKVGMKINFAYDYDFHTGSFNSILFDFQTERDIVKAYNVSCNINKPKYLIEKREIDIEGKLKEWEDGNHLYNAYSILKMKYLKQLALIIDQKYEDHILKCDRLYMCHPSFESSLICTALPHPTREHLKDIGYFRTLEDIQFASEIADKILYKFHGLSRQQ
jgi:hypothetical protein